jgi:predicted nucleic acid-binding protein
VKCLLDTCVVSDFIKGNAPKGTPIGSDDILIAATATTHDLILVTSKTSEFSWVPTIQLENWR